MRVPVLAAALFALTFAGCAPRYRHNALGGGNATLVAPLPQAEAGAAPATATPVVPPPPAVASVGVGPGLAMQQVAVRAGSRVVVRWHVQQPMAERIGVTVDCGGAQAQGEHGETLEAYRARRIAELRAEAERQRQAVANLTGSLIGNPGVVAGAQAQGQQGAAQGQASAQASAHVDGQAVGTVVAAEVISTDVVLPPGDIGGGPLRGKLELDVVADGACTMAIAGSPGHQGDFTVTEVIDLRAVAQAEEEARSELALGVRADLTTQLTAVRGDWSPLLNPTLMAEVPYQDVPAEVSIDRRIDASVGAVVSVRPPAPDPYALALHSRGAVIEFLVGTGKADLQLRGRLAAEAAQRSHLALSVRGTLEGRLIAGGALPRAEFEARLAAEQAALDAVAAAEYRARTEAHAQLRAQALITRHAMAGFLIALGAVPMPAPRLEVAGAAPFDGAVWVAGRWDFFGGAWVWIAGGWTDPRRFGEADLAGGVVPTHDPVIDVDVGVGVGVGVGVEWGQGSSTGPTTPAVRDHRDDKPVTPAVRDHRDDKPVTPVVRDHRDDKPAKPEPKPDDKPSRDHRDDDDKPKPVVRDHR